MRCVRYVLLAILLAACGGSQATLQPRAGGSGGAGGGGGSGGAAGAPVDASSREVSFASAAADSFLHVGTLQIPAHVEGERLPAVIFAHGSGPNDRDETLRGQLGMSFGRDIPVFAELGDALQDAGFVVLRFDKRSCGPFNGCADNGYAPTDPDAVTIDTFVEDVEGGLAFLASQPEVDAERLFFVGHSKGASYAPRLLTDHPQLRAGVMLAAPFVTIDRALVQQAEKLEEILVATGASEAQIDAALADVRAIAADVTALHEGTFAGTRIGGLPVAYWNSWLRLGEEAPALAAALDRPLLVLSGGYDWNVPQAETEAWAAHFGERSPHETRIVPCVTHALNCIDNPDWMKIRPGDIGAHVDPAVIEELLSFLAARR